MTNREKYDQIFIDQFSIDKSSLDSNPEYNKIDTWDSIGHMELIADIEDAFDIVMDGDDIIDFSSYRKGMELLAKYLEIEG